MSRARTAVAALLLVGASVTAGAPAPAQDRGAIALAETVEGLGNTMRVLMIGAHPDDEDTQLLAWLARGRHVQTAYLSLTRGDGGQNLIGNELGEALGAIRTEELLAARRVDGAEQFFTRAYDFGFSKTAEETYRHWPKDSVLGDVVRVVRSFRPHVIVAVFSGTPRDGHGHHQVSGLLAREAYEVAGDDARFPAAGFGPAWAPLKLYGAARFDRESATLSMEVGEYDPVLGRSYAELAGESRSQHRSQGFGALQPRGRVTTYVRREQSRAPAPAEARDERTIFAGIDTTWRRFAPAMGNDAAARAALDSLPRALADAGARLDPRSPERLLPVLARAQRLLEGVCGRTASTPGRCTSTSGGALQRDLASTAGAARIRLQRAVALAAGLELEARVPRELLAAGRPESVTVTLYNRGRAPVRVATMQLEGVEDAPELIGGDSTVRLAPGEQLSRAGVVRVPSPTTSWWLARDRRGDVFDIGDGARVREDWRHSAALDVIADVRVGDARTVLEAPVAYRFADPVLGDRARPLAAVPAVAVMVDRPIELVPAGTDVERAFRVRLRSADPASRTVTVRLALPRALRADSAERTVTLGGYGMEQVVTFTLRGRLAPGSDTIRVVAESGGERFTSGYSLVDYEHVRPQRLYRPAATVVEAVDVQLPAGLRVAYVPGVGDNVAPMLQQLGVPLTVVAPEALAGTDLSRFSTVVVGPRAYEAHPQVMASRARLLDFARAGGTLVVQYQQNEVHQPGVVPYPMTVSRPHDRVTVEESPVRIVDAASPVLAGPNRITARDFDGWVQERSLYMPRTFDDRYAAPLELQEPGEEARRGALLVAPLGRGRYVYVTLSLFRQLPAGVPGAARLFVNLLATRPGGATP